MTNMTKGKIIAGIVAGTAIAALLTIPKTRKMIAGSISGIGDSLKEMASNKKLALGKKIPVM